VILFNDANSDGRQNSDVAHELAHGLLLHEPKQAIVNGCRLYDATEEDEASWLSGCLLVPRDAALVVASSGQAMALAAQRFGVSTKMMEWRINSTGARRQADAARRRHL
jgi:Zn-dependent peptidase ImmA (M78 family)